MALHKSSSGVVYDLAPYLQEDGSIILDAFEEEAHAGLKVMNRAHRAGHVGCSFIRGQLAVLLSRGRHRSLQRTPAESPAGGDQPRRTQAGRGGDKTASKTSKKGMTVTMPADDRQATGTYAASTARVGDLGKQLLHLADSVHCDADGTPGAISKHVLFDRAQADFCPGPLGGNTKTRITLCPESTPAGSKHAFQEQLHKQSKEMADHRSAILRACFADGETVQAMNEWYQGQTNRFTLLPRTIEHAAGDAKYQVFLAEGNEPFTHMAVRHSAPGLKEEVGWEKIGMETLGTCAVWGRTVGGQYRGANSGPADNDADANSHYTTYITLADAARWTVWYENKYCSGKGAGRHGDMYRQDMVGCPAGSAGVRVKMSNTEADKAGYPWSKPALAARNAARKLRDMCEDCGLKGRSFGLEGERKKRWCSVCAKAHEAVPLQGPYKRKQPEPKRKQPEPTAAA